MRGDLGRGTTMREEAHADYYAKNPRYVGGVVEES